MEKDKEILQLSSLHPNEVRLLLEALKVTIEQVSSALGPHGPLKLANSLALLQRALGESFEDYLNSIKDSPNQEHQANTAMSVLVQCLCNLHNKYLGYLLPADPHSFPVELLHPLKDFLIQFGDYSKEKTSFGLLPWDQYNFRVAGFTNPLRKTTKQLKSELQMECPEEIKKEMIKLPEYFVFFNYPQAEGRNVFLHGILFHELGHAIDWKKRISQSLIKAIKWPGKDFDSDVPNIFGDWVKEITADLVATRLWGPCVLFSSRLTSLTVGVMAKDLPTHPSSRFRSWWMLEHLRRMGYMGEKNRTKTAQILRCWHKNFEDPKPTSDTPTCFTTVRSVLRDKDVADALQASVEKALPGRGFDAESFSGLVPSVVANFKDRLPHCGEGIEPASHIASVFNAVWEKSLQEGAQGGTTAELWAEREILCNLALKSIEGNYIQSLWSKQ